MQKIKLIANSNIDIPSHLSNVDMRYGYSYYSPSQLESKTVENSFAAKILSKIDKFFTKTDDLDKKIVAIIAEKTDFLAEILDKESVQNLNIQLNANTSMNQKIKGFLQRNFKDSPHLMESVNAEAAHIYSFKEHIIIGLEFFKTYTEYKKVMKQHFSLEEEVSFTLFHEVSHSLEHHNKRRYGWDMEREYDTFFSKLSAINNPYDLYQLNKYIKETYPKGDFAPLDEKFIYNLRTVQKEFYADVGAILLQRNYNIKKGTYSPIKLDNLINAADEARKSEMQTLKKYGLKDVDYIGDFNHFTSPAMDTLKEELVNYPDRVLTEEEIHKICQKCTKVGFAKIIATMVQANNQFIPQFKTLFSLSHNPEYQNNPTSENPYFIIDNSFNYYYKGMMQIKEQLGDWFKNLEEKAKQIHACKSINNKMESIFHAGLIPKTFEDEYKKAQELEALADELFGPSTPNTDVETTLPTTPNIQANITRIREKTLSSENTINAKINVEEAFPLNSNIQANITKIREKILFSPNDNKINKFN